MIRFSDLAFYIFYTKEFWIQTLFADCREKLGVIGHGRRKHWVWMISMLRLCSIWWRLRSLDSLRSAARPQNIMVIDDFILEISNYTLLVGNVFSPTAPATNLLLDPIRKRHPFYPILIYIYNFDRILILNWSRVDLTVVSISAVQRWYRWINCSRSMT